MSVIKQEFDIWLTHLTQGLTAITEILSANSLNADDLLEAYEELLIDVDMVEGFRPKTTGKQTYEFSEALSPLAAAKRLMPKIVRILTRENKIIPPSKKTSEHGEQNNVPVARKIPEMIVQTFEGDITAYASFRNAFGLKYDSLPLMPSEKLAHLKSHLHGPPLTVIRNLDLTDANYARALASLDEQYNRPDEVISELYHRIDKLPRADKSTDSLQATYYALEGLISALESHGQHVDAIPPLRDRVLTKYPLFIVQSICRDEIPPVKKFQKLMSTSINLRKSIEAAATSSNVQQEKPKFPRPPQLSTSALVAISPPEYVTQKQNTQQTNNKRTDNNTKCPTCLFCSEKHYSAQCTKFSKLSDRLPFSQDRCHRCLGTNHKTAACNRSITCRFCKEKDKHNSAFCPQQFGNSTASAANTMNVTTSATPERSVNFVQRSRGAHNTILVSAIHGKTGAQHLLRVLLDMGSNDTYISEQAARFLGLPLNKFKTVPITVFGNQHVNMRTAETEFEITNNRGFHLTIQSDTVPNTPQEVRTFDYVEFCEHFPAYANMNFVNTATDKPIDIVLGNDYVFELIKPETKITVQPGLFLVNTEFGFILTGRQVTRQSDLDRATLLAISPASALDRLCALDVIGITEAPISQLKEEEHALEQFYANLKFIDHRYQIRWPWRSFPPPLVNNFGLALGRLKTQLKRLTDEHFEAYDTIIAQQLSSGIVEEVPDALQLSKNAYYVPHHPVYTPEKSTPLRIVYDGSAKPAKDLNSINDAIYKGRNLLADITAILLRFRMNKIAIVADLEKCFHQLEIHPFDRDYVRFLWVRDRKQPILGRNIRVLRFTRVAFGIVASPFLSNAVINHHLQNNANDYFSSKDIYVDNLITGAPNVIAAQNLYEIGVQTFLKCSMNLRSWASNSASVREFFKQHHRDGSDKISILGILWDQYEDTLKIKPISTDTKNTLRSILSTASTFYDPCGWFAPITIQPKLLMQEIRDDNFQWDDQLPKKYTDAWNQIQQSLKSATEYLLSRFHTTLKQDDALYELHCFADASKKAYAAVVYLRIRKEENTEIFLLFAKARIAPKKTKLTIPKLELIAANLGARILKFLQKELYIPNAYLWSDSKCVLHWILTSKILPSFIQRRVAEIRDIPNLQIRYVPTALNPADAPSRGVQFEEINQLWWNGPPFLSSNDEWPATPSLDQIYETNEEQVTTEYTTNRTVLTTKKSTSYPFEIAERYRTSFDSLMRISTYIIRFLRMKLPTINRLQMFESNRSSRQIAQLIWVRADQRIFYADVLEHLKSKKKHPLIRQLQLELDDDNLIRCTGRYRYAPLSEYEKRPLLLPHVRDSLLTRLVILFHHERNFHVGTNYTLAAVRRTFWIPAGRAAVYTTIKKCVKCKRFTCRPFKQPDQSDLPDFRLQPTEVPFTNIGIDIFGHLWISRQKRYVLLVTDLITRAVDMEPLRNLTAQELVLAFRNIVARRTSPRLIFSDNAPQFELLRQNLINTYQHELTWKFIPEKASWMGGVYERMVALAKNAILKTFHNVPLTDALLRTALAEIAAVLNERPLTYLASDTDDLPLTPNHFLQARFPMENRDQPLHDPKTITASNLVHLWKRCDTLVNHFWSLWKRQYLSYLREQHKLPHSNQSSTRQPAIGEVVLIAEPNIKKSNWKLGRIISLNTSEDGKTRSVTLKTNHRNIIVRPVNVLYPLEISDPISDPIQPISSEPEDEEEEVVELNLDFDI